MKSYASYQWVTHQERYIREMYMQQKTTDLVWLQRILLHMFRRVYARWKTRNEYQHNQQNDSRKKMLLQRITGLYSLKSELHTQNHHCFSRPLKEWEQRPTMELQR